MASTDRDVDRPHRIATGIVAFLGLYQGVVPLVVRGVFDRDQRFAPALWLASPWWWIACLAIAALALVLIVAIDASRQHRQTITRTVSSEEQQPRIEDVGRGEPDADRSNPYDSLSGLVLLVGLYNGIAPFIARIFFDGGMLLAFPLRLSSPWWWITSLAVIAATAAILIVIDQAKQRSGR